MRSSYCKSIIAMTIILCGFLVNNNVSAQEKSKFEEGLEDRQSIGLNVTGALPFRSRSDNSLVHYINFNSKGKFHKHVLLLNVRNNDSENFEDEVLQYTTDSRNFLAGYNFAFGRYKPVHEKVNLLYGPQFGYQFTDVRNKVTYSEWVNTANAVNTIDKHQLSAGIMGGLEIRLSPQFSLYTEASLLAKYRVHVSQPQVGASTTSHSGNTSFNISKNLVLLYNF